MQELKEHVAETLSSGNISLRLTDNTIAIKPSGFSYAECIDEDHVAIVGLDGKHIQGPRPSSDIEAHLSIYNGNPKVTCIIHTHSHYATVMSTLGEPLKILSTLHADYFGQEIPCMPYTNHRTDNFGAAALKIDAEAMLLAHHGALIFGNTPSKVIRRTIALEEIARLNYHIRLLGHTVNNLNIEDIAALNTYYEGEYGKKD